jgi:hypothetical protein
MEKKTIIFHGYIYNSSMEASQKLNFKLTIYGQMSLKNE